MSDPRLDRLPQFDVRSRNFRATDGIETMRYRSYTWRVGSPPVMLNQGLQGACVGFSWAHELAARPCEVKGLTDTFARERIYWEAQKLDVWEGGEYPGAPSVNEGTSILAGAKACQALKLIGEYRWAFGLDDVRRTLGYRGPMVLGMNWHAGMMKPELDGRIQPTGPVLGGHAILAYAVSERLKRVKLWNSWGDDWGPLGPSCYLTFDDLAALLAAEGEACIPVQRFVCAAVPV